MNNTHYLIIEDQEVDALITYKLVKHWFPKFMYIHKYNGIEALEYLADKQNPFPKFILVDIKMPLMGGFEFLREYEFKYFDIFPETKVIVFTTSMDPRDQKEAISFKCVSGFIQKPIDRNIFDMLIEVK